MSENVVILGASANPERYAYLAKNLLTEFGHNVFLVNPNITEIEGEKVYSTLLDIEQSIDTLTIYVNKNVSDELKNQIVKLAPKRVIFNPGSENPALYNVLKQNEIAFEEACTLVLLRTGQF